jgi:hypothetical protein
VPWGPFGWMRCGLSAGFWLRDCGICGYGLLAAGGIAGPRFCGGGGVNRCGGGGGGV